MNGPVSWRWEALLRLLAGVLVCVMIGSWVGLSLRAIQADRAAWALSLAVPGVAALGIALRLTLWPWPWEVLRARLITFTVSFYVGLLLLSLAHHWVGRREEPPHYSQVVVAGLSFQGAALLLITRFLRQHGSTWGRAFGLGQRPGWSLALGAAAGGVVLLPAWALQILTIQLLQRFHQTAEVQVAVQVLQNTTGWAQQLALAVVAIGLAPPAEEALFRGLLFRSLHEAGYRRLAWLGTSLLFALVHANAASFVALVVLALWLTWLYQRTGNLLAPIAAHAVFNALNFAAVQLYQRAWQGQ